MAYIYLITNKINNKVYVGKTITTVAERYSKHIWSAKNNDDNCAIHYAMRKYGLENFEVKEVEVCSLEEVNNKEIYWIKYYDSYNNGYNETIGGEGNPKYDYSKIYKYFLNGLTQKEISERIGCEKHTITRALKAYDVSEKERQIGKFGNAKQSVVQIDLSTNTILKRFASLTAAAEYEGCSVGMLSLVCNNKRKLRNKTYTYQKEKIKNV